VDLVIEPGAHTWVTTQVTELSYLRSRDIIVCYPRDGARVFET